MCKNFVFFKNDFTEIFPIIFNVTVSLFGGLEAHPVLFVYCVPISQRMVWHVCVCVYVCYGAAGGRRRCRMAGIVYGAFSAVRRQGDGSSERPPGSGRNNVLKRDCMESGGTSSLWLKQMVEEWRQKQVLIIKYDTFFSHELLKKSW